MDGGECGLALREISNSSKKLSALIRRGFPQIFVMHARRGSRALGAGQLGAYGSG